MAKDLMALVREKKKAIEQQSGRREKTVKPPQGKSRWRILPGWRKDGDPQFYHDFGQHFIKNKKGEILAVYVCRQNTFDDTCEICDKLAEAIEACDSDDALAVLKEAAPSRRILMNALHLDGEDPKTPVILDLTPGTFDKVLDLIGEYGADFLDLKNGVDIVINRTGKGINTEYNVMASAKSQPVDPSVMAKLHNLDEYVQQEYEQGKQKALAALGKVSGNAKLAAAGVAGVLTGPKSAEDDEGTTIEGSAKVLDDDEIPFDEAPAKTSPGASAGAESSDEAEAATASAAASDNFDEQFTDEDIEKLLGDMS